MAYQHDDFVRMAHAFMGIPYDPIWHYAESCLHWWQRPFSEWLIDRCCE